MSHPDERSYRAGIFEEVRPWGRFRSFPLGPASSLKIITVSPGASLSLQYHVRRSEFWVVLDPGLELTVGERTWTPEPGDELFIPPRTPHRLRGLGPKPGRVMELWLGKSEESDIVRVEDRYGRV